MDSTAAALCGRAAIVRIAPGHAGRDPDLVQCRPAHCGVYSPMREGCREQLGTRILRASRLDCADDEGQVRSQYA